MRLFKTLRLASRDYTHEWQMSGCFVLALAAVLGPMLVLFGLKFGVVGGMLNQLIENPENREIRPITSGRFDMDWFGNMQRRMDVAFLVPRTQHRRHGRARQRPVRPHRAGRADPFSRRRPAAAARSQHARWSQRGGAVAGAAEKLKVRRVTASTAACRAVSRAARNANTSSSPLWMSHRPAPLGATAYSPTCAWSNRSRIFSMARGTRARLERRTQEDGAVTGFPPVRQVDLRRGQSEGRPDRAGVEVRTKAGDIDLVMRMDRNLSAIYWAIAIIGLFGFSLSLGASLWANVDRKRKELSVLRLVGFRTGDIVWFPVTQAFMREYSAGYSPSSSISAPPMQSTACWSISSPPDRRCVSCCHNTICWHSP